VLRELSVAEQRYQAVLAVIEDGVPVTAVANKHGVSRQAVHAWLSRYAEGGLEALADRSHRPRSCPHQMDPAIEVRLVELRGLHPGWGPDRLRYRLEREGVEPLPSRAAIGRALARLGLIGAGRRRSPRREYRRWERGRPMELWQLDVMGGVLLGDGGELKAVTAIDDHSRFCPAVGLVERATSRPVCGVLARILAEFGAPEAVLTDNGKVFTGRFASRPMEVLFDRICLGVRHPASADRPALADHDRQDRALPRHAAPRAAHRADVPHLGDGAAGDRRLDHRVQHRPATPGAGPLHAGRAVRHPRR
jgi:transposase-like protein